MSQYPNNFDSVARTATLGDSYIGKSAIVQQFCDKRFGPEIKTTLGIEFRVKIIEADGKKVKLQVWDTAGQERFRTLHRGYYRGTHGIILCYAINNRESFEKIEDWVEEIRQYASKDVCIVLVGNKCDLSNERVVSFDEGVQKAGLLGIKFFETSAKEDINIEQVYFTITRDINKVFGKELSQIQRLRSQENNSQGKTQCFKCS